MVDGLASDDAMLVLLSTGVLVPQSVLVRTGRCVLNTESKMFKVPAIGANNGPKRVLRIWLRILIVGIRGFILTLYVASGK
jgi:hypothetical protein